MKKDRELQLVCSANPVTSSQMMHSLADLIPEDGRTQVLKTCKRTQLHHPGRIKIKRRQRRQSGGRQNQCSFEDYESNRSV
jgi:hypothetical protein